jgi:hypothetical protein
MMSGTRSSIGGVQRSITMAAVASLLAGGVLAGCGGGRIGEIASERAATAAVPNTTATSEPLTTITTAGALVPAPAAIGGTSTDLADAGTRFGTDIRDIAASVAAIQIVLTGVSDPASADPALDQVTTQLQAFDRAAASMGAYRVAQDQVEALRARAVAAAPAASDAIRAFIDSARQAMDTNDAAALATARKSLDAALSAFLQAVPPTS